MARRTTISYPLALLLALWGAAAGAASQEWSLAALMGSLAQVGSSKVRYSEARHLSILEVPLQQQGWLIYRAPSLLKKLPDGEGSESFEIEGEQLRVVGAEGGREIPLASVPGLHAFVASLRATLAGDLETLQHYYRVALSGTPQQWQLQLTPLDQTMALLVREILIHGSGQQIKRIETYEQGGDYTLMTLQQDGA